jgi:uncharacterized membrane protein
MASSSAFWKTMGMGVIAGMRSMSAPALLSGALREQPSGRLAHSKFSWLQNGAVSAGLKALAGTFGAFALRKLADNSGTTKEPWTGFVEDALVVAGGKALLHNYQPRQ